MTQAPTTDTMTLQIVSCETCDMLFLVSLRRETCPTCGGPPGVVFFSFEYDGQELRQTGSITDEAAAAAPPPPAIAFGLPVGDLATVDQEPASEIPSEVEVRLRFLMVAGEFLAGVPMDSDEVQEILVEWGADAEAATAAVGRLEAVRQLVAELAAGREQPGAAGPEDLPPPTAETEPGADPETAADAPAGEPDDVPEAQTFTESPPQPS